MENLKTKFYTGNITLEKDVIFVFGSNPEGRHGAGSAKVALNRFGAQYGKGEGLYGKSYALPTTDLRKHQRPSIDTDTIIRSIERLYKCAAKNPNLKFKVAYRNGLRDKTLSGYTGEQTMNMFLSAGPIPENIYFSEEWVKTGKFE